MIFSNRERTNCVCIAAQERAPEAHCQTQTRSGDSMLHRKLAQRALVPSTLAPIVFSSLQSWNCSRSHLPNQLNVFMFAPGSLFACTHVVMFAPTSDQATCGLQRFHFGSASVRMATALGGLATALPGSGPAKAGGGAPSAGAHRWAFLAGRPVAF